MRVSLESQTEEVQEIISQMPTGLIRWGISLIFFLFVILLLIGWFLKYPDTLKAKVVVTTDPSPINLVSRTNGKILLLKKANEPVKKNEIIAYVLASAAIEDIFYLETQINSYKKHNNYKELFSQLDKNIKAGEVQSYLNEIIKALQSFIGFDDNKLQVKQTINLRKQMTSYQNLNQNLQKQLDLMRQEGMLSYQQYKTDSLLFMQKVIALIDFNKAKSIFLTQQRSLKSMEASIISNQLQVDNLEKQITELSISSSKEENELKTNIGNAVSALSYQIKNWKENFLFIAPIDGVLAYLGFTEDQQYIEREKPLFAVLPHSTKVIAKGDLPVHGSGKVKVGQPVNIRLSSYPFEQFGMLQGKIESISEVPDHENYSVIISMPKGMTSTHNLSLTFRPQLQGETEIITEDIRLLERIFYQFRKLLTVK